MTVPTMDKLPRVPDAHGDVVDEKIFSDLYIRTSWVDANVALDQIKKVSHFGIFFFLYLLIFVFVDLRSVDFLKDWLSGNLLIKWKVT